MKRLTLVGLSLMVTAAALCGQAVPVTGADDPTPLFTDPDPVKNRNKQAAMHIVFDLLSYGHWNESDKWITEEYIQHNPCCASGRMTIVNVFGKNPPRAIPANPKDWTPKIVSVVAEKDIVIVANRVERPDPRNPGQTYTTTHFDMWRFVNGKASEHWDEGGINIPAAGKGAPGGGAPKGEAPKGKQ